MDKKFMDIALDEAKIAALKDEVPVGAVIVKNGEVIASAHNLRETLNDPTAHAEILAIKKASGILKNWRLNECEMYVTLEPCPMCSGAILQSRIRKLYIGTIDPSMGCCGSVVDLVQNRYLKTALDIKWFNDDRCSSILTNFFRSKRK
ncbi:adenosine deaminase [Clostridium novyi A str. 4570]|uniref:tRNA-specific adenosine deaminase n=1 Tax=Clostridium novyi A str. 4570 TaxID=1444290 RepID=A0AA88ZTE7_CLONO|nr:nucleoside deaminase [Clostridium novyi]KGN00863.1 adenosine deaminase [Clostridium novyi A str. 4570]